MKAIHAITVTMLGGLFALGLLFSANQASAEQPIGFSQAELDQMLAPVALYPDTVLSHVLIAATYPLEVVQAARWSRAHPEYTGENAVAAVEHKPWDPSVMALVAFPELLARMDADLNWTQRLGDAFLVQEYEVLDTIQYLRDDAYAAGHLRSNEYVRVVREPEYIYIEPAVTRVVYVPYYDPRVVYGSWRYSAYPPVYWDHPRGYRSGFSFHWSSGHHVQSAFFFSSFHWSSHKVVVHDHHRYGHRNRGHYGHGFSSGRDVARYKNAHHWKHNPEHRRGVAYRHGVDERHQLQAARYTSGRQVSARTRTNKREYGHDSLDRSELLRRRSDTPAASSRHQSTRTAAAGSNARSSVVNEGRNERRNDSRRNETRRALASGRSSRNESDTARDSAASQRSTASRARLAQSRSQSRSDSLAPSRSTRSTRSSEAASTRRSTTTNDSNRRETNARAASRAALLQSAPGRAATSRAPASQATTTRQVADTGQATSRRALQRSNNRAPPRAAQSRQRSEPTNSSRATTTRGTQRASRTESASRQSDSRERAATSGPRSRGSDRGQSSRANTLRSQRRERR